MSGYEDWAWGLPILWEQCVCLGCGGVGGGELGRGLGPEFGRVGWCYVHVSCESGSFV